MSAWEDPKTTALLVLQDGTVIEGIGIGAVDTIEAEVCFNTAMTGYQEILTDPSYAGQIVTFTFPHIGNVGINEEDVETVGMDRVKAAAGCVIKAEITNPSNYRSVKHFDAWLKERGIVGICGVDTRALTNLVRENGMPNAVLSHGPSGTFDIESLKERARAIPGLVGVDLASDVTTDAKFGWSETPWVWNKGYMDASDTPYHVVALDYGVKRNILRLMSGLGCRVSVLPATASAEDVLALKPDGIFLSNGPGDPAATGSYALQTIRGLLEADIPLFGICLGHQMLALALGAKTVKMHQGHHGANHPVKDHTTGKVEIVSMNHGFAVDGESLPDGVTQTHVSLFDGSNCGLEVTGRPVFSVQHHPEASPGPQDSHYLFRRFVNLMRARRQEPLLAESDH
ncbi:MAG: glutamine-hydrolyzing carbamoyl-phosphate synthase small subunit [Pseudomonadota bacterium]